MEICAFVEPQQGADYDHLLAFATTAERLGFDGFFRSDHYASMGPALDDLPTTDAWTTLAGLARETTTLRLGTLVSSATYRHPGILAVQVAGVDRMSGGRVELGLGTGWFEQEHTAYGIPFPDKRFDLLEEQLEVVTGLWGLADGETFDHSGAHYELHGAAARQRPAQERLPIIIGGSGPTRTPALAARYATEFNSFTGPHRTGARFDTVRAACETAGRDPGSLRYSAAIQVVTGETDAEVDRRARRQGDDPAELRANPDRAVGSVDHVTETVARYRALGAGRVYLQFIDIQDLDHLALVGERVLPALRAA